MAEPNNTLIVPQPIYQLNPDLVASFKEEILKEREKSSNLSKQLEIERYKSQQLEEYLKTLAAPPKLQQFLSRSQENMLRRPDSICSVTSFPEDLEKLARPCSPNTRKQKIERYKRKMQIYKQKVTFSRSFTGRSKIAKVKPRVNGKFIKVSSFESFDNTNI